MKIPVQPGDKIDHYRIEGVADASGATSVFRATDLRTNLSVAIKIPHPEMESDPVFTERFQREEEIGRTLDHPGILKVFADDDRSQSYIVTEWFDGQPLRQILSAGKLPHERAVRIALNISNALAYIQNHGIVHRDLRPENILVDAQDHIKLINFGVAAKAGARRITFTSMAQVVGMSEYISPEELNGKRGDARSDIYALGAILYEMLTEKAPFQGESPYDRLVKPPTPPREIDSTISPQLQEVIYRALERDPRNRYANAHEFALDLSDLNRVGVAERPELRNWKKRSAPPLRKVLMFAALALVPIAIFALLFYFARS
jgi:eukaryotic-like serine/threonine-protein kinase